MSKERFRKNLKQKCPDCGCHNMKLVDEITEDDGVEYVETVKICDECGYYDYLTNKKNRSVKFSEDF